MRVATLTTRNENGCGPEAGNHKGCPYEGLAGSLFSYQSSMSVVTDTTDHENGCGVEAGNHKGCPYEGLAGALFSCQ